MTLSSSCLYNSDVKRTLIRFSIALNLLLLLGGTLYVFRTHIGWYQNFGFFQKTKRIFFPIDNLIQDYKECHPRVVVAPKTPHDLLFIGASNIGHGSWKDYFPKHSVVVQGFSGDCAQCLLPRLPAVLATPAKSIFLLVGTNDLWKGRTSASVLPALYRILASIKFTQPTSHIYVQSLLPLRTEMMTEKFSDNATIDKINVELKKIAELMGVGFIDISSSLKDSTGELRRDFTPDGIHLTPAGYANWVETIKPYVENTKG